MGKVIQFERGERPEQVQPESRGPAELLMFTGIRYDRSSEAVQPSPVAPEPATPRRTRG